MSKTSSLNADMAAPFRAFGFLRAFWTAAAPASRVLAIMLLALPTLSGVLFWPSDDMGALRFTARFHSIPVLLCEIVFIVSAGRSTYRLFANLPRWMKIAALLWLIAVGLSFLAMENIAIGAIKTIGWLIHGAFALQAFALLRERPQDGRMLAAALVGSGLLYLVPLTLLFATVSEPAFHGWRDTMPGFLNVRQLGFYYAAIAILAAWPVSVRTAGSHWPWLMMSLLFVTIVAWSGSRASVLAIVAVWTATVLFVPQARNARCAFTYLGIIVAGLALSQLHSVPSSDFDLFRTKNFADTGSLDAYSSGRLALWAEAIRQIGQSPLFGHGAGQSIYVLKALGGVFGQPHNAVLQFLLEWGFVGGVSGLAIVLAPLSRAPTRWKGFDALAFAALGGLMALFIASLLDAALYHPWPIMMFIVLGAIAYRQTEPQRLSPWP